MEYIDRYNDLKNIILDNIIIDGKSYSLEQEFEKFFIKGNKAAGRRIRKMMQLIRRNSELVRNDVQSYKKSL